MILKCMSFKKINYIIWFVKYNNNKKKNVILINYTQYFTMI